jgi:hypothetical protein
MDGLKEKQHSKNLKAENDLKKYFEPKAEEDEEPAPTAPKIAATSEAVSSGPEPA